MQGTSTESQVGLPTATRVRYYLRALGAMVSKDLATEWRSREMIASMLVFGLLVILIFNFALELDARTRATVTAGVLWVTFGFAGTLGLNRSMAIERERGCLDGLLLAPIDRSNLFWEVDQQSDIYARG